MIRLLPVLLLAGCVSDSIVYDPATNTVTGHRTALFTNIGSLSAHVETHTDGSVTATIEEKNIDQMTAAANALEAAAKLALKAGP